MEDRFQLLNGNAVSTEPLPSVEVHQLEHEKVLALCQEKLITEVSLDEVIWKDSSSLVLFYNKGSYISVKFSAAV